MRIETAPAYCACGGCDSCNLRRTLAALESVWADLRGRLRWPHAAELDRVTELVGEAHTTLAMHIERERMETKR